MGLTTKKYFRRLLYLKIFLMITVAISIALAAIFYSFPASLDGGYHNAQALLRDLQKVLISRVVLYCALTFVVILPAMIWILLFYSHRIAGPAYRIGRQALRIGKGDLVGGVVFRQHDALTDMADSINALVEWYRHRLDAINTSLAALDQHTGSICQQFASGEIDRASLERATEEISKKVAALEASLEEIRT